MRAVAHDVEKLGVRVRIVPQHGTSATLKLDVGRADARVDDVRVHALARGRRVVDVVCIVGLAVRDAAQAPGGVFLGGEVGRLWGGDRGCVEEVPDLVLFYCCDLVLVLVLVVYKVEMFVFV